MSCQTNHENNKISDLIQEIKLNIDHNSSDSGMIFEWIPYDQFNDIKEIGKGGFSTVYSVIWNDGLLSYCNIGPGMSLDYKWKRESNTKVALKCLHNSQNFLGEFINEGAFLITFPKTGQDRPGPKDRLTILTDNISKLSNAIYTKDKPIKQSKRSSPYEKTSYEQTKKKHYTRSSNKSSSPRISADDSDSFPQTEDDTIMHQDLTALTDNAADDGIIEPDSDYTQNDNISGTLSYGYNIFNFGSRK
ncbi:hypothetical protein RirG_052780 [Rhizophagus irregularis DAOM 197198w]|uniref:Protein kinase domain-containing protein n=2 Tax=Rhizophagus irregularis TaxID=588596 RepID=A0A015L3K0_RHIIW|nr:hypothetical protein RirG_052780 [Rhizophagus irregularis DAOM 197198w]